MTSPALISVKASLTRMTPLLATGCCASVVACLSGDPGQDWAVGERLLLFSASLSDGCELEGSDPPKSTSSSKFPVGSGGGDRTLLAARFSTLRDLGSLTGGPGCCCVACPVSTDLPLFCAGAIGLLGIASGCRHPPSRASCSTHDKLTTAPEFRRVLQAHNHYR